MKKLPLLAFIFVLAAVGPASAQVLSGFGSSDTNPIDPNPLDGDLNGWVGVQTAHTFDIAAQSNQGGGLSLSFAPIAVSAANLNDLSLSGSLITDPVGIQTFSITVFDASQNDTRTYQFKWNNFTSTDSTFTGTLLSTSGVFTGGVSAFELDTGGDTASTVSFSFDNLAFTSAAIPEPSTYAMFAFGGLLLYGLRRKIRVS